MNNHVEFCMLAEDWDGRRDLSDYLVSEKLDGVRGRWLGKERRLITRRGNRINAPDWFTAGMPDGVDLDLEFWIKRNFFNETRGIIARAKPRIGGLEWKMMRMHVFDVPSLGLPAAVRLQNIAGLIAKAKYAVAVQSVVVPSNEIAIRLLVTVLERGGEGLMAIHPASAYQAGMRSKYLVKVRVWQEAEATVVKRNTDRHSVRCKLPTGIEFDLGLPSYFWQAQPPKPDDLVTFRYWQYDAKSGVPRWPTIKGVRDYE